MTFRARLALVAASAVALAVVAASFAVYFIVKNQLREPIDESLKDTARQIQSSPNDDARRLIYHLRSDLGGAPGFPQGVLPSGQRVPSAPDATPLPIELMTARSRGASRRRSCATRRRTRRTCA